MLVKNPDVKKIINQEILLKNCKSRKDQQLVITISYV